MKGRVKWFDENRGVGVIKLNNGGKEVTVHYRDILGDGFKVLDEGEEVELGIEESAGRVRAIRVRKIEY